jgi:hypothetical protein
MTSAQTRQALQKIPNGTNVNLGGTSLNKNVYTYAGGLYDTALPVVRDSAGTIVGYRYSTGYGPALPVNPPVTTTPASVVTKKAAKVASGNAGSYGGRPLHLWQDGSMTVWGGTSDAPAWW